LEIKFTARLQLIFPLMVFIFASNFFQGRHEAAPLPGAAKPNN
jgi:hypothetical protein